MERILLRLLPTLYIKRKTNGQYTVRIQTNRIRIHRPLLMYDGNQAVRSRLYFHASDGGPRDSHGLVRRRVQTHVRWIASAATSSGLTWARFTACDLGQARRREAGTSRNAWRCAIFSVSWPLVRMRSTINTFWNYLGTWIFVTCVWNPLETWWFDVNLVCNLKIMYETRLKLLWNLKIRYETHLKSSETWSLLWNFVKHKLQHERVQKLFWNSDTTLNLQHETRSFMLIPFETPMIHWKFNEIGWNFAIPSLFFSWNLIKLVWNFAETWWNKHETFFLKFLILHRTFWNFLKFAKLLKSTFKRSLKLC